MTLGVEIEPYVVNAADESLFSLDHLVSPDPVKPTKRCSFRPCEIDSFPLFSPPPNTKSSSCCQSLHSSEDAGTVATANSSSQEDDDSLSFRSPSKQGGRHRRRRSSASSKGSSSKQGPKTSLDMMDSNEVDDDVRSIRSKGLSKKHKKERRRSSGASSSRSSISSLGDISMLSMTSMDDEEASIPFSIVDASDSKKKIRRSTRKRTISFNSRSKIRAIPPLASFSEEEKCNVWYREGELKAIKQDALNLLKQVKNGTAKLSSTTSNVVVDDDDEEAVCVRGLGSSIGRPGSPQNRRSNWIMALTCVLDEQVRQKELGMEDPEHIAKLYRAFAVYSQQSAIATGRQDAKEVGHADDNSNH